MDYRNLLGIATIILSGAVFVHSLKAANALPNGPNISSGTNPVAFVNHDCYGANNLTLLTNTSNQNFIISDIWITGGQVRLFVDGTILHATVGEGLFSLQTGLKIESGSTISCSYQNGSPRVVLTGYYAH